MAVGNSINYSIPVVGSTVATFARAEGNVFTLSTYSVGGGSYPAKFVIRGVNNAAKRKRFGITFQTTPSSLDDPGSLTKGSATVSVNIDALMGSIIDNGDLANVIRHSLSMSLHSNLFEDLMTGVTI